MYFAATCSRLGPCPAPWRGCGPQCPSQPRGSCSPRGAATDQSEKHDGVGILGIQQHPTRVRLIPLQTCCRVILLRALRRTPALGGDLGTEGLRGPLVEDQHLAGARCAGNRPALWPRSSRDPESWSQGTPVLSPRGWLCAGWLRGPVLLLTLGDRELK